MIPKMKKKYSKQRTRRRYARPSPTIGRMRWIFFGVLLIVIIGVVFFSNSKNKPPSRSDQTRHAPLVTHPAKKNSPPPKKSEYDFYTMLPKMQVEANTRMPVTPANRAEGVNKKTEHYALQIASFKNFPDADRMRGQLLMMGFSPSIQKYIVDEQVWHRIYIGPYHSRQAAIKQQQRLHENSISSVLVNSP
jgi:cell division protein FtsN